MSQTIDQDEDALFIAQLEQAMRLSVEEAARALLYAEDRAAQISSRPSAVMYGQSTIMAPVRTSSNGPLLRESANTSRPAGIIHTTDASSPSLMAVSETGSSISSKAKKKKQKLGLRKLAKRTDWAAMDHAIRSGVSDWGAMRAKMNAVEGRRADMHRPLANIESMQLADDGPPCYHKPDKGSRFYWFPVTLFKVDLHPTGIQIEGYMCHKWEEEDDRVLPEFDEYGYLALGEGEESFIDSEVHVGLAKLWQLRAIGAKLPSQYNFCQGLVWDLLDPEKAIPDVEMGAADLPPRRADGVY